jgi:prepilin-type N-terminal cleavage/methylation domain-containing protein
MSGGAGTSLRRGRGRQGFTLVELLVAIGIILILFGFLVPALTKARQASKRTQCASQLHQIGLGLVHYFNDYRGLPAKAGQLEKSNPHVFKYSMAPGEDVSGLMVKYCGPKQVFYCPANLQDRGPDTWWPFQTGTIAVTYQFPFWLQPQLWRVQYPDYRRLSSERLLAADVLATSDGVNNIIQHNHTLSKGGDPTGMNELFGDGHVAWTQAGKGWVNYGSYFGTVYWHYAQY